MLTDSVGVLSTAALAPQLPLPSTSVMLSQSLQSDDTTEMNVETSTHDFVSRHASPTDSGGSLATDFEGSWDAQPEASGENSLT